MKKILLLAILSISFSANALMLNLKNAEIKTFINTVSMASGKNFMIDPRVRGKVNIISNREIDDDQLYQVFLTVLKAYGFIVIEGESVSRIVPKSLTKSDSAYTSKNANDTIITTIIKLKNITATQLIPIVRPLMSQYGLLSAYPPANSIIVVDSGSNIARLQDIVKKLDNPVDSDFEFIPLKNTSATDISTVLKSIFGKNAPSINVDKHNNQLIIGGTESKRLKVRFLVLELDKHKADSGSTAIIYLKYADAKKILPILQNISQHNTKQIVNKKKVESVIKSNIQADESTNSIIVTGDKKTKQTIKDIITKLDVRKAQVLIEAVIVEISSSSAKELGIQWIARGGTGVGFTNLNGVLSSIASLSKSTESTLPKGLNFIVGNYNKNKQEGLGLLISALNGTGKANILSTPSIVTLDNEEAEIVVGQEVPFITNTQLGSNNSNPFQNYERKDVGLKLKVKPQINNGSSIKLDIEQETSNVLPSSNASDLITSKRSIKTSVMVEDGKLLVLGGLIDDSWRNSESSVPILGSIPILGALFRTKIKTKEKRNLFVFIRPTILKNQIITDTLSMEKYNFIKAQQLLNNDSVAKEETVIKAKSRPIPENKAKVIKKNFIEEENIKRIPKIPTVNLNDKFIYKEHVDPNVYNKIYNSSYYIKKQE